MWITNVKDGDGRRKQVPECGCEGNPAHDIQSSQV